MMELDPLIHQPVRLRIMAALTALPSEATVNFVMLRSLLDVTDGNLSAHLNKLENAQYICVAKSFSSRKPLTMIRVTEKGRKAFEEYTSALQMILNL